MNIDQFVTISDLMPDFGFDTGPLLYIVENDEFKQLEELDSILIHSENRGELKSSLRKRKLQDIATRKLLEDKWDRFCQNNRRKIKDESSDSCRINRTITTNLFNLLASKKFTKVVVIMSDKYYDPHPATWFRYLRGSIYIITNHQNYQSVPFNRKLEIEVSDFSAFMLTYARCCNDQTNQVVFVTNDEELLEFSSNIDIQNLKNMLIPMFVLYSFSEIHHNILNLLLRIKKFLLWKQSESTLPEGRSKYWKSTLIALKEVINNIKDIMIQFAYNTSSQMVKDYMQVVEQKVLEDLNRIELLDRSVSQEIDIILKKYTSLLNYLEEKMSEFDIDGYNLHALIVWSRTIWNTN